MDWAYLLAGLLGVIAAAFVALVAAGIFASAVGVNQAIRVGGSVVAGVVTGAVVCVLAYWFLHPLLDAAVAATQ